MKAMIFKKVENPKKESSKRTRITGLSNYLANPEKTREQEKCIYFGARGFISDDLPGQQSEMIALAEACVKSKDPVNHYVISWQEGEQPTAAQVEEIIDELQVRMKVKKCQIFYGLHSDTDNIHLHVMLNRVNPENDKAIKINRGKDIEIGHQIIAAIEAKQGWEKQDDSRYTMLDDGHIVFTSQAKAREKAALTSRALDIEAQTGEPSILRIVQDRCSTIIAGSKTWQGLHAELAKIDARYYRKGSGAEIVIGDAAPVKASSVHPSFSFGKMQKRLGPYEPEIKNPEVLENATRHESIRGQELHPSFARRAPSDRLRVMSSCTLAPDGNGRIPLLVSSDVRAGGSPVDDVRRESTAEAGTGSDGRGERPDYRRADDERNGVLGRRGDFRNDEPGRSARPELSGRGGNGGADNSGPADRGGRGRVHNNNLRGAAVRRGRGELIELPPAKGSGYAEDRRAFRAERTAKRVEMRERHEMEKDLMRDRHRQERQHLLGNKSWAGRGHERNAVSSILAARHKDERQELVKKHREERSTLPKLPDLKTWQAQFATPEERQAFKDRFKQPGEIRGHGGGLTEPVAIWIRGFETIEARDQVIYCRFPTDKMAFADHGERIEIPGWRDHETTLAALQLAAGKWGSVNLTGPDEYKQLCVGIACQHGIQITNPELQEQIRAEQARLQQQVQEAAGTMQKKLFDSYHSAIQADRYRITAVKYFPDGTDKGFVVDRRVEGFTPDEVVGKIPDLRKLHNVKDNNIHFTPLSKDRHHIVVDDLTEDRFKQLCADGYKPAVLIETSPKNYQVVINVPKLGTDFDKDIANRLASELNSKYGDPEVHSGVQPHRCPGFKNLKPKHLRDDGTYPPVRLLDQRERDCPKCVERSVEIHTEMEALAQAKAAERAALAEKRALERQQKEALERQRMEPLARYGAEQNAAKVRALDIAYTTHRDDVMSRQKGPVDYSRIDSMIALRMRATGHEQHDVAQTILRNTETERADSYDRLSDLGRYADRAAASAWTERGDTQLAQMQHWHKPWRILEDKARQREGLERPQAPTQAQSPGEAGQEAPKPVATQETAPQEQKRPELPENVLERVASEREAMENADADRQKQRGPELG